MSDYQKSPVRWRRREILQKSMALGGVLGLAGCATAASGSVSPMLRAGPYVPPMAPMRISLDRMIDLKCCIRPFRAQGPRLDTEVLGDTLVVHNYGHGGSGWSLSWGSAQIAVDKAMATLPGQVAVIGCGIVGLSTAITAQRAGAQVTIYARDLLPRTRSVRANGSWTPDSRIALTEPAGPQFGALWERMARTSWHTFRSYLGLPGRPVDFSDFYSLSDNPDGVGEPVADPAIKDSYATKGLPVQSAEFGRYSDRIRDLTPTPQLLPPGATPFKVKSVRSDSRMFFNFGSYGDLLLSQFFSAGGKVEIHEFHSPAELTQLKEKVVINCPGYAARDLWRDPSIIPVRGQTAWLVPQTEVNYGLAYNGAFALSKSDGVMIQGGGPAHLGDMAGVNDSTEVADRPELEKAIGVMQALFANFGGRAA